MEQPDEVYEEIPDHCNSCAHYDSSAFGKVNYGNCRRFPPITVEKQKNGPPRGIWPVVGYDDFCGEHG